SPIPIIVAGLGVFCAGIFTAQTCGSAYVGVAASKNRALAVGLYAGAYHLGGSVGAAIPGFFYNMAGWPACAAFIAIVQAGTALVALRSWTPHKADASPNPSRDSDGAVPV